MPIDGRNGAHIGHYGLGEKENHLSIHGME